MGSCPEMELAVSDPNRKNGGDNLDIGACGGVYGLEGAISEVRFYDYARRAVPVRKVANF